MPLPRLRVALLFLAVLVTVNGEAFAFGHNMPGEFDYYALVLGWAPSYCLSEGRLPGNAECQPDKPRTQYFEMMGKAGLYQNGSESYRSGIAGSISQSSTQVLDRFLNIPPTITIREGHRVKVYFTQDLLLPAYENHTVAPNI